jgi:branched-chain amino acid transport system ATP-binding protein
MMVALLQVQKVSKLFGKLVAVDSLDFEVEKGEVYGVAGPNGSGKTTLFNLITGVYPFSGQILFDGKKINGATPYQICHRGIARTFQIPQVFLTLPVFQNIRVGAHFGGNGIQNETAWIHEVMEFVGLKGKETVPAANLKLLDKKRTMLGAALATKPKILLLDEPIAGLNPEEIRESVALFKKINEKLNITILIIEHFMKVLVELSNRLMILENGVKICTGPPLEVADDKKVIECYLGGSYA